MCGCGSGRGDARKLSAVVALNRQWVMCAVMTPKVVFITLRIQRIESVFLSPCGRPEYTVGVSG